MAEKPSVDKAEKSDSKSKKDDSIPKTAPVFDVSKPGESAASPTSRPVIVGHKAILKKDPMVADDENDKSEEPEKKLGPKREIKLEPTSAAAGEVDPKPEDTDEKPPETEEDQAKTQAEDNPKPSDAGAIDALAEETSPTKHEQQKAEAESVRKKAEIEKLAASRKYNLPIHDTVYSGSGFFHWFINITLIVLIIAAGVILAIDAELISLEIELPFDLIK